MPRGDQIGRLLRLLDDLRAAKFGVTAAQLAERHGWRRRTVYRDLRILEDWRIPLTQAPGARWKIVDGWQGALPFPVPPDERLALLVARQFVGPLRGTKFGRAFDRLCDRVLGDRPSGRASPRQGDLFQRLRPLWTSRSVLAIDYARHEATIETLCRAMENGLTVRATYFAPSRGELTVREIEPYDLYWDPGLEALYLFAYCRLRGEVRTFAVHRFRNLVETRRRYVVPVDFSTERYLEGAFRIWRERNSVPVRLLFRPPASEWVAERRWHASQEVVRRSDGGCELRFRLAATPEVERFVLGFGAAVEVLEPLSLRRAVAREHAAAARRALRPLEQTVTPDDTGSRQNGRLKGRRTAGGGT